MITFPQLRLSIDLTRNMRDVLHLTHWNDISYVISLKPDKPFPSMRTGTIGYLNFFHKISVHNIVRGSIIAR